MHIHEKDPGVGILAPLDREQPLGGVSVYLAGVAAGLRARGVEVAMVCLTPQVRRPTLSAPDDYRLPPCGYRPRRGVHAGLAEYVARHAPDVVHLHGVHETVHPLLLARMLRTWPIVYTFHDVGPVCYRHTKLRPGDALCEAAVGLSCLTSGCYHLGERMGALRDAARMMLNPMKLRRYRRLPLVIAPSAYLADQLALNGIPRQHLRVVPNFSRFTPAASPLAASPAAALPTAVSPAAISPDAVAPAAVSPATNSPPAVSAPDVSPAAVWPAAVLSATACGGSSGGSPPDAPQILFVGRLEREKGILHFVEALGRLAARPWRGVVAGEGPLRESAQRRIRELGLGDRVEFRGAVAGQDLPACYASTSVVVMPSLIPESFGMVGVEALSFARPVVAFAAGGVTEWLDDGRTGLLARHGDAAHLADQIARLLDDPGLRTRLGEYGQQVVRRRFTLDAHLDRLLAVYAELPRRGSGGAAA